MFRWLLVKKHCCHFLFSVPKFRNKNIFKKNSLAVGFHIKCCWLWLYLNLVPNIFFKQVVLEDLFLRSVVNFDIFTLIRGN